MTDDPYERIPYTDHAYAEAHPDRLAVVARLSRWRSPPVEQARVLDVGCARGGHVLPMASGLRGASFVGIDRAAGQVAEATRIARECGLTNVGFVSAGFEDADLPGSSFDYVTCHGLWSWVAKDARRALLRSIAKWLAPDGVAYVSFNALPGWYERLAARDWLRFAARIGSDPRDELDWLRARAGIDQVSYRRSLDGVAARLDETDRAYLVHEFLAMEHHPELVTTFLSEAEAAGLRYLGDAIPSETAIELLDADVRERARGLDLPSALLLADFARNNAFRRALLVRADVADVKGWRAPIELDPTALTTLRIAARGEVGVEGIDPNARAVLDLAAGAAPRSVAVGGGGVDLVDLWLAGGIEVHAHEATFASQVTARPRACPVARWHAENGGPITNLWHHEVVLKEPIVRAVLARCDGARSIEMIARETGAPLDLVRGGLELLARSALLVA
jgi:SAM-dependent methyltransferase